MPLSVNDLFGTLQSSPEASDLLVYLHIPFCRYRCTFCDWVNQIPPRELLSPGEMHDRYVEALRRQILEIGPRLTAMGYAPRLVYWGGGTPTILDARLYAVIVQALSDTMDLHGVTEHSIEATPDTVTGERVRALKAIGVTRVSIGVQSMDPDQLRKSGRGHSPDRVREAAHILREEGIDGYNLDVMIGLPDQTMGDASEMIAECLAMEPAHMTLYAFRPTAGTQMAAVLKSGRRKPSSNDALIEAFRGAQDLLERAGYAEYMTGYYARSAKHRFEGEQYYFGLKGDYFGFGAGANSILRRHQFETRRDSVAGYIEDPLVFSRMDRFSPQLIDSLLLRLRTTMLTEDGICYDKFQRLFGFDFSEIRRHPMCEAYIEYFRWCGAEFVDDGERLYVTPETRTLAHLRSYGRSVEYHSSLTAS